MRKSSILAAAILSIASFSASAANDSIVFSCTITDGKPFSVTKSGGSYTFSYDKVKFNNAVKQVLKNPQSEIAVGSGFTTISLELRNKGQSYITGYIQPRGSKEIIEPGFSIVETKSGEIQDYKSCDMKKSIKTNFDLKSMRSAGL